MIKGTHFTPEQLERLRLAHTNNPNLRGHRKSREAIEKQRLAMTGRKLTEEHKRKIGEAGRGRKHTPEAKEKIRLAHIGRKFMHGKHFTREHRAKLALSHRGEKSPLWRGGIYPLNRKIRDYFEYRQWRSDIFTRDNFTCQGCGIRGSYLHAHHIKSFRSIMDEYHIETVEQAIACSELWNMNNGIALCKSCHMETR